MLDYRQVAEKETEKSKTDSPNHSPNNVVNAESAPIHAAHPRNKRCKGSDDGHEPGFQMKKRERERRRLGSVNLMGAITHSSASGSPCKDDGLGTVLVIEALRLLHVLL